MPTVLNEVCLITLSVAVFAVVKESIYEVRAPEFTVSVR
jgi:hypothetical protein